MIIAASELTLIVLVTEALLSLDCDDPLRADLVGKCISVTGKTLVSVLYHNVDACNTQIVENVVDQVHSVRFTVGVIDDPDISQHLNVGDRVNGHRRDENVVGISVVQVAIAVEADISVVVEA